MITGPAIPDRFPNALAVSHRVLRGLIVRNGLYVLCIVAMRLASLVAEDPVMGALGVKSVEGSDRLILFVLARVFEHGARMRADLEGTV